MPRCERHDTISFFVDPANAMYCAQLLPQLQALLSKTTSCSLLTADSSVLAAHCARCLLLRVFCLLVAAHSYRAGAALEDQGRGQRAGSHADQARIVHAPCVHAPYSHHACTVRTIHGTPPTPCVPPCTTTPQASFARGGLLLADYINAMSTAMCAVKVRGCLWSR